MIAGAAELASTEIGPSNLRTRLETLTFAGVVTRYTFTFTRHAGFNADDLALLRWDRQRGAAFIAPRTAEDTR